MEIKTQRLLLREFEEDDWKAILEYHAKPEYLRYYPWKERSEQDAREFVSRLIAWQNEEPRQKHQLAITLLIDRNLIGNIGVRITNPKAREAEFGLELNPYFWHKGFAFEAAQAMLRFGFKDLDMHRIWAQTVADNTSVRRLLEKIGMRLEGQLHHNLHFKNRWWDTTLYSILKEEWLQSVSNLAHLYLD
ncbi:MAG: GNAT family N-acetyltransferase [Anaerolineales bacterium]|nr:GNAT family N-acetyltransferase [Anaerolineales bacterium]